MDFEKKSRCNGSCEEYPDWLKDNEYIKTGYRINYIGYRSVLGTFF